MCIGKQVFLTIISCFVSLNETDTVPGVSDSAHCVHQD